MPLSRNQVSDEAYGSTWDGVGNIAPSKNAVYDKIETLGSGANTSLSNLVANDVVMATTVSLSSAQIKAIFTTPVQLIAAPGAGKVIFLENVLTSFTVGGTQYTAGGQLQYVWAGGTTSVMDATDTGFLSAADINGAASIVKRGMGSYASTSILDKVNTAINAKCTGSDFATGDGTIKIFLKYRIVTL